MSSTTDLDTLVINYLTQAQYEAEKSGGTIDPDQIYLTPAQGTGVTDVEVDGTSVVSGGVAEVDLSGKADVSHTHTKSQITDFPTIPTKVSDLTNDSGYITTETDPTVPSWAKASSKPSYTAAEVGAVPTSRTVNGKALSSNITLSASDVSALPSSTVIPTITDTYSGTSSDGMSGKAVKSAIDALPTVNNATLTIQKNGTTVKTFTANASSNVTANITVPTDTDDLTNGAGYITSSALPTKVSDLANDAGYITGYTETDPTVPSWAKASSKPSYTFSEIGSKPTTLSGYGITDAKIASGTITLGSNTITPLTSFTETDPVFTAHVAHGITSTDISNWNEGKLSLDTSAASGTTDGDLYSAIVALGWENDVIE